MRRPFPRAGALLVPALGAALAAAAIGTTLVLQDREDAQRNRQVAILSLRNDLNELNAAPWRYGTRSYGRTARGLEQRFAKLGVRDALASLAANFATLEAVARAANTNAPGEAAVLRQHADELQRSIDAMLVGAGRTAAAAARRADEEANLGSAAVIVILAAAFVFLHRRLARAHEIEQRQRIVLEDTLGRLEGAQADRMRLLASTVHSAEEERRRIAADLHDGPIQRLTATAFSVDLLANRIRRGHLEAVEDGLREVRDALAAQMESLRRLMVELRPPVLDEGGVAAAIANHASQVLPRQVICSVRDGTGAVRFMPELEMAVYRIAGEALANVAKHACATKVEILLVRRGSELALGVTDDGIGFDAQNHHEACRHVGLATMRERVESLGGRLSIRGGLLVGTRIEATLPWRARAEDHRAVA